MNPENTKKRSRFDLFVILQPGNVSHYPEQKRRWCYRGDKFTDIEAIMLQKLLNHLNRHLQRYCFAELYDNNFTADNPERAVLIFNEGVVEKNDLKRYQDLLTGYTLPNFLKF